ncbi:Bor/Iss family lipoprotein [Leptospira saintgironsiae]|uniref:Bor/Iss family lipoprotein n=1 Tax=Leptospira saintgironsiae TaxID=2023183 RepID=UPI0013FE0E69
MDLALLLLHGRKKLYAVKIYITILLTICFSIGCRHAWISYPQKVPEPCRLYQGSKECKLAMEERANHTSQNGPVHSINQTYYLFGLYPSEIVVNLEKYCPSGPKSAHQFQSFADAFWEQITLLIYSPRTLEIECYPI